MVKKTLYDVLQVSRNADPEIIKAAYKSLAQRYHPDKNTDNPDAEKHLKEIDRAYEVLSDPVKRAGYDAALADDDEEQTASSKDWDGFSSGATPAENDASPKTATTFDRSTTPTTKRNYYYWTLDFFPMAAVAQLFKSIVVTRFHGSPDASGWAVFFAMLFGSGIGIVLFQYIRTKTTKNMQNQRTVFFVSLSLSIVFTLAIATTTVLLERSAIHTNPLVDISSDFAPATPIVASPASPGTELQQTMALAEQGNAEAQVNLGILYHEGRGVPQDYAQAAMWYRKAAEQGNADAQLSLGIVYYEGQGVSQDYAQAAMLYRKAADQGNADAQYSLARMYGLGQGVEQNSFKAYLFSNISAANGGIHAVELRDIAARTLTSEQINKAQQMSVTCMNTHYKTCD